MKHLEVTRHMEDMWFKEEFYKLMTFLAQLFSNVGFETIPEFE